MRLEKLMIGDWLSLFQGNPDGSSCNVRISYIGEYGEVGIDGCEEYTSANCNLLFPIPLTREILEKNGFMGGEYKSYTGYVWYLEEKGFSKIWFIMSCEKSILCGEKIKANGSIGDNFSIPNIKYVHELQHALRLCGINKEITI